MDFHPKRNRLASAVYNCISNHGNIWKQLKFSPKFGTLMAGRYPLLHSSLFTTSARNSLVSSHQNNDARTRFNRVAQAQTWPDLLHISNRPTSACFIRLRCLEGTAWQQDTRGACRWSCPIMGTGVRENMQLNGHPKFVVSVSIVQAIPVIPSLESLATGFTCSSRQPWHGAPPLSPPREHSTPWGSLARGWP